MDNFDPFSPLTELEADGQRALSFTSSNPESFSPTSDPSESCDPSAPVRPKRKKRRKSDADASTTDAAAASHSHEAADIGVAESDDFLPSFASLPKVEVSSQSSVEEASVSVDQALNHIPPVRILSAAQVFTSAFLDDDDDDGGASPVGSPLDVIIEDDDDEDDINVVVTSSSGEGVEPAGPDAKEGSDSSSSFEYVPEPRPDCLDAPIFLHSSEFAHLESNDDEDSKVAGLEPMVAPLDMDREEDRDEDLDEANADDKTHEYATEEAKTDTVEAMHADDDEVVAPMLDNDIMDAAFGVYDDADDEERDRLESLVELSNDPPEPRFSNPFIYATPIVPTVPDAGAAPFDDAAPFDETPVFSFTDVDRLADRLVEAEQFEDFGEDVNSESFLAVSMDANAESLSASTSSLRRQLSSSALASQLYRSREGSDDSVSVQGPISEDDDSVAELRSHVVELERLVDELRTDNRQANDRVDALKAENQRLVEKAFELEDQVRSVEDVARLRAVDDERAFKETTTRLEQTRREEADLLSEQNSRLAVERDKASESARLLQRELDSSRLETMRLQERLLERDGDIEEMTELQRSANEELEQEQKSMAAERRKTAEILEDMAKEMEELKAFQSDAQPLMKMRTPSFADLPSKVSDLEAELKSLRAENAELRESREELQVQIMTMGMESGGGARGGLGGGLPDDSLEAEMERASREELVKLVQEEKDINKHLKEYVDKIILVILENQPELLEVMATMEVKTRG